MEDLCPGKLPTLEDNVEQTNVIFKFQINKFFMTGPDHLVSVCAVSKGSTH